MFTNLLSTLGIAILIYVFVMLFFIYVKPSFMYDHEKKKYKPFKTGSDGTIFPIWGVAIFMGIASYLIASYLTSKISFPVSNSPDQQTILAPVSQQANSPFLSKIITGGNYQPQPMCASANTCFMQPVQQPVMMGGGYYPIEFFGSPPTLTNANAMSQQPVYNLPPSKVWKKL